MNVQVHQTEIVGIETTTFAKESYSAVGLGGGDADLPLRRDDAVVAVCCWYPLDMSRVD